MKAEEEKNMAIVVVAALFRAATIAGNPLNVHVTGGGGGSVVAGGGGGGGGASLDEACINTATNFVDACEKRGLLPPK